jgi:hypothetical protein
VSADLEPCTTGGTYVNALEDGAAIGDAYSDDVLARLVELKRRYDPHGAFAGNGMGAEPCPPRTTDARRRGEDVRVHRPAR